MPLSCRTRNCARKLKLSGCLAPFLLIFLLSGCETPQPSRPVQSPPAAQTEVLPNQPTPATVALTAPKAETSVRVTPPRPQPAVQPEIAASPRLASATKSPGAPAKAAPPHFPPPVVTSEIMVSKAAAKTTAPGISQPILPFRVNAAEVHRPQPQLRRKSNEVGPAGLAWFGCTLVMVGLVSFGYPSARGRLEGAMAGLKRVRSRAARSVRPAKETPERIHLDGSLALNAAAVAEPQPENAISVETAQSASETSVDSVSVASPQFIAEPGPTIQFEETIKQPEPFVPAEDNANLNQAGIEVLAPETDQSQASSEALTSAQADICSPEESSTAAPLSS